MPRRPAVIAALVVAGLGVNLPFVTQAFHIDDRLSIYVARQILASPLNPYDFAMVFGGRLRNFHDFYANPPLGGYLLAMPLAVLGESEVGLHAAYAVIPLLAGLFMYLLARRFALGEREAIAAAGLLILCPGVFTMGHTVMPDVALLWFYTAAVYFFVGGVEKKSTTDYALAGFFAAAASLTRYSGLTLVPLFLGWALLRERTVPRHAWLSVVSPLITVWLWFRWAATLYGGGWWEGIVSLEAGGVRPAKFGMQLAANVTHLGGAAIFAPALLLALKTAPVAARTVLIGASTGIALVFAGVLVEEFAHSPGQVALFLVFGVSILSFLGLLAYRAPGWFGAKPGRFFLAAWVFFLVVFNAPFLHTAVKYNLLEMPPLIILFILLLREAVGEMQRPYLLATVVLTGIVGVMVAVGDWRLADAYRTFAEQVPARSQNGNRVFYAGDWGWDYYMSRRGARPVSSSGTPALGPGDVIFSPIMAWPQPAPVAIQGRMILKEATDAGDAFPVRTMSGPGKAFFYANLVPGGVGVLPWSLSTAPLETFLTIEVQ